MAFCSKCGNQLAEGMKFCGACGQNNDAAALAAQAQPAVAVSVAAPTEVLTGFRAEVQADGHFMNPRIFDERIFTPVAIAENGYVGTWQIEQTGAMKNFLAAYGGKKAARTFVVLHVNEIASFEVLEKQTSGAGAAAVGALTFGAGGALVGSLMGAGKSTRIDLKIVTTRPDNPMIVINLYDKNGTVGSVANPNAMKNIVFSASARAKKMDSEIMTLCSALEGLLVRNMAQPQTVVQQSSTADELLKYKQLLDSGLITQEEFDAKKRQLMG